MARNVKFGVALFPTEPASETVKQARLAERLGYDGVWVGDSHIIWRELYVIMGAIASQTKRIGIGSGVTHPHVRHLSLTASAFATLSELAPGRISMGIGIGASGPRNIGVKPVPLQKLAEGVERLRQLLRNQPVELDGNRMRLMYPSPVDVPIYIAANSPRTREMAGRIADGVILGGRRDSVAAGVDGVRRAVAEAGRPADSVKIMSWIPCSLARDGKSAREAVKPHVARSGMVVFTRMLKQGEAMAEEDRLATERLNREYDFSHHMGPEHSHLVPERWVDLFSIAGSPEQVRARIVDTINDGVDLITIVPYGDKESIITEFAKKVMSALR
ncbi:MAG: LLM class flavin-dependent oxidoreductase [Deltaproteobacteria bacterium]|nr:LLM class flavin-dependent oxidoreductase [Deltaproteobacteria bacterium]